VSGRSNRLAPSPHPELAGNLSTGLLKLIALFFMFIDHTGKVIFNNAPDMRLLGRIAFPLYAWCMIVGFCRTRSVPKYLGRILQVCLVSQPLYYLALNTEGHLGVLIQETLAPLSAGFSFPGLWEVLYTVLLKKPNIFLTLFLGLCTLWGIRKKKYLSQIWGPAIAIALATVLNADYGWKGVTLFILLYAVRNTRPGIAAVMISFFLFWGAGYELTKSLFGIPIDLTVLPAWLSNPLKAFMRLETYGLLALPLILIRFPHDLRMPKWLSYSLYPAHLVIIILLKLIIFG
jgi:hypothetical protein